MALTQSHYRFGIDELAESTHGWHAAEDVNPNFGVIPANTTFLLRFTLQDSGTAQANVDPEFQYRKNGGTWTQITTSTSNVKAVTPGCWANAANTTKRLSGTGTFIGATGCTSDGIAGGTAFDIAASGNGETECALQLVGADLVPGDLIEFRLTRDGAVLIDTYAVTPALGIPLAASASGESVRSFDRLQGVAAGVLGAFLSVGLLEAPVVRIADTVSAALIPPSNLSVQVYQECLELQDFVFGAARNTQVDRASGLFELPPIKLRDTLTVVLVSEIITTVPAEGVKADDGGRVNLIGLGNPIKITDGPPIAVVVDDNTLAVIVSNEALKVVDSTPIGFLFDPNLMSANVSAEAFKSDDGGRVDLMGLGNPIRITDTVNAELVGGGVFTTEIIKWADQLSVVYGNILFVSLNESVKVIDSGEVELGKEEYLLLLDSLTVERVNYGPIQTALNESLRVVDTTLVLTINPEQAILSESLKAVDDLTVTRQGESELQTSFSESLKVSDSSTQTLNPEQATSSESLKVVDQLIVALGDIWLPLNESLKVQDAPSLTLNPEQATPSESLKVVDQLTITMGADLATGAAGEVVKISDAVSLTLNPEQAQLSESVKVVDALTVVVQLAIEVGESCKVVDTVNASRGAEVNLTEGLSVVDTVNGQMTVLNLQVSEGLKVVDGPPSLTTGTTIAVQVSDGLKVADQVTIAVDPEERAVSEALKVSDTLAVALTPVLVDVAEGVKVVDTLDVSLSHLDAVVSEGLKVVDNAPRFTGPSIIEVVGSYVTSITVIGSYVTSIEVVGSMGDTE